MRSLAVLSLHTSPLAQPGSGDGGGMNVYVRELSSALALAGVDCDVYTRACEPGLADVVELEPGFRVHNVRAGPPEPVAKEQLPELVGAFTAAVRRRMETTFDAPGLIHANYWLSGVAGHDLKHALNLPLVSTFHTLARVKAETCGDEPEQRAKAEAQVIAGLGFLGYQILQRMSAVAAHPAVVRDYPVISSSGSTRRRPSASRSCRPASTTARSRRGRAPRRAPCWVWATARCCCSSAASSASRAPTSPCGRSPTWRTIGPRRW